MEHRISRKVFLRRAAGFAAAGTAGWSLRPAASAEASTAKSWPWPYTTLDEEQTRKLAHACYYERGCGYAGFAGIIKNLQEKAGDPFTRIPPEMMSYAGGGIQGWGTVCGALNGASAAISLVCDARESGPLIEELLSWYTRTLLPSDIMNRYAEEHLLTVNKGIQALTRSTSGSPLCHISVSRWCKASGLAVDSPERFERCARLSGDVAAQAVRYLNSRNLGKFKSRFASAAQAGCISCHGPKGAAHDVAAKQDCRQCHQDPHK